MKKVAFATLGCRYNQFETVEISEDFKEIEYEVVPFDSDADLYVINTCTVTKKSDVKCRQLIRRAIKRKRVHSRVIVIGCYSETASDEILAIKGVDAVLGNREKLDIRRYFDNSSVSEAVTLKNPQFPDSEQKERENIFRTRVVRSSNGRTNSYLKVQTGCDMSCSYCVVRIARGKGASDTIRNVFNRASEIIKAGYKEIVLTGINLGRFGWDLSPRVELSDLLEALVSMKADIRIRLSSINPTEVSDKIIRLLNSANKICRHLHIPLQSGDDEILQNMRRNYTAQQYRELIHCISETIPHIGIGTDILTGFPGETEDHHQNTYKFLVGLPLSYFHVFRYSRREGTDAARYTMQVPKDIKNRRSKELIKLGEQKNIFFRKGHLAKTVNVLFENSREKESGHLKGFTDNYISVLASGDDTCKNRILPVTIKSVYGESLKGSIQQ